MITPLHSRLQPCSGKAATTCAASRSTAPASGQAGWCVQDIGFSERGVAVVLHDAGELIC
jgi:hypothetical protein